MQRTVLCIGHKSTYDIGCLSGNGRVSDGIVIFTCNISLIKRKANIMVVTNQVVKIMLLFLYSFFAFPYFPNFSKIRTKWDTTYRNNLKMDSLWSKLKFVGNSLY